MSEPRNDPDGSAARTGNDAGCLPRGYRLHEFVIDSVLGEGGFGVVYTAIDTRLERKVAIKEYMPTSLATRDADLSVHARSSADHQEAFGAGLRSFVNEAKLLARFEHPALVKVYQFWEERGTAYMVMPLYTAPTFKRWIKQRKEPVEEAWLVEFLDGAIDALEALHRENCLHRDVAPDNILVLNEASPLLLDFGAARRVIGDMTHDLTVILKPGFAPVEQYAETSALKQGPWTDVYALCAVGYYAITGKAPMAAVARMVNDEHLPLRQFAAGRYSPRLLTALDTGLRVRPQDRPLSMAALRAHLFGEAVTDERTTVITSKAPAPLSPAPGALHSTFKPNTDTPSADDEATRVITARATAQPAGHAAPAAAQAPRGAPATMSPSAAPTYKMPPRAPVAPPATAPATAALKKRGGPWLWVGSFAAGGAALVLGIAWWIERPYPAGERTAPIAQAPAPAEPEQPATKAIPSVAPAPSAAPGAPAAAEPPGKAGSTDRTNAPVQSARAPERAAARPPAAAPPRSAEPAKKAAPPPIAAAPSPATKSTTASRTADQRTASEAPRAGEPPKAAESAKPMDPSKTAEPARTTEASRLAEATKLTPPPALRAPEGPPPLAVTDRGIPELQVASTVDPKQKEPKFAAYTCCNLHYDGDWVSDLNYSTLPRIPAGTPIKVVDYGRWRVFTEIGGRKIRLGLDYGRSAETLAQFARKLTVDHDLRFRLAQFPPIVQDAIRAAKLLPGMTKEQVVISVGFPSHYETKSVNDPAWKFWLTSRIAYSVIFDANGRIKDIEIDPGSRSGVVYEPRKQ